VNAADAAVRCQVVKLDGHPQILRRGGVVDETLEQGSHLEHLGLDDTKGPDALDFGLALSAHLVERWL